MQTESLLRGNLSLTNDPTALFNDWAWNGAWAHQVWGLGVPLLRLPFEAAARVFGADAFPDRIVLLLIIAAAAAAVFRISWILAPSDSNYRIMLAFLLSSSILLDPLIFGIVQTRMKVYEEAALCLASLNYVLWALILRAVEKSPRRLSPLIGAMAGFLVWIRPTGLFYGLSGIALLYLVRRKTEERIKLGTFWAGYLPVVSGCLYLNYLRFGSPLEFGHSINLTLPDNALALRFGTAFSAVPLSQAIGELSQALFTCNPFVTKGFFHHNPCGTELPSFRFREYYFTSYSVIEQSTVIAGLILACALVLSRSLRPRTGAPGGFSLLWGISTLLLLGGFYLYSRSLASRYFLDLTPAIGMITAGVFAIGLQSSRPPWIRRAVLLLMCLLIGCRINEIEAIRVADGYGPSALADHDSAMAPKYGPRRELVVPPELPRKITCPGAPLNTGSAEPSGWAYRDSCALSALTSFLLPASPCLELSLLIEPGARPLFSSSEIRVKRGREKLLRFSSRSSGHKMILNYCGSMPSDGEIYSMFSIRWNEPTVTTVIAPQYKLESVEGKSSGEVNSLVNLAQ